MMILTQVHPINLIMNLENFLRMINLLIRNLKIKTVF